jgi:CRISPR type III-A-associated protein Csm2
MALKINELTAEEYDIFCDLTKDYVRKPHFKEVTTSKIRNIFSAIQNAKTKRDLKMLRPKLAYLAGRDNKTKSFMNDLDKLIKKIENDDQVNNFKQFFEAIICYKREIEK